ncbi:hypothetical protein ACC691_39660, partial [Rhizobium johnstonii]|uniref:hypothetical protein n=1 Tax=Rhizobium johnstonii TaxID=3019933 RepID=UPI003F9B578E
ACRGDGLLLNIADPLHPTVIQQVRDSNVSFWHSGIFSNDGSKVVFQDELGDGFTNTCTPSVGANRGADSIWTLANDQLAEANYFK